MVFRKAYERAWIGALIAYSFIHKSDHSTRQPIFGARRKDGLAPSETFPRKPCNLTTCGPCSFSRMLRIVQAMWLTPRRILEGPLQRSTCFWAEYHAQNDDKGYGAYYKYVHYATYTLYRVCEYCCERRSSLRLCSQRLSASASDNPGTNIWILHNWSVSCQRVAPCSRTVSLKGLIGS